MRDSPSTSVTLTLISTPQASATELTALLLQDQSQPPASPDLNSNYQSEPSKPFDTIEHCDAAKADEAEPNEAKDIQPYAEVDNRTAMITWLQTKVAKNVQDDMKYEADTALAIEKERMESQRRVAKAIRLLVELMKVVLGRR